MRTNVVYTNVVHGLSKVVATKTVTMLNRNKNQKCSNSYPNLIKGSLIFVGTEYVSFRIFNLLMYHEPKLYRLPILFLNPPPHPAQGKDWIFEFYYPLMNISLRWMISDHRTDTHVLGTSGHNSLGYETLTTSGAGFPVRFW